MNKGFDNNSPVPVKWKISSNFGIATANAGLLYILETLRLTGLFSNLPGSKDSSQGWTDAQMLTSLVLLNVTGFDRVSDVDRLEDDEGLRVIAEKMEPKIMGMSKRRIAERFRRVRRRIFPSSRSIHDWLGRFHLFGQKKFGMLDEAVRRLVELGFNISRSKFATIDLDATIIASHKKDCKPTYRAATGAVPNERGYQPLIAYCPEIKMVLYADMREGNVPASKGNLEAFEATLSRLPVGVEQAMLRTDCAGYQESIIRFCNDPSVRPEPLRRFETIALVTSAIRSPGLMKEVAQLPKEAWKPLLNEDGELSEIEEVAEVGFVSNMGARQKSSDVMRYVAIRRPVPNELGIGSDRVVDMEDGLAYKVSCCFTNIPAPDATASELANGLEPQSAEEIVRLSRNRCGGGESVHSVLKSDLAAGILPSGKIEPNAGWLQIAVLSLNIIALCRLHLGGEWLVARMKRFRAVWINNVGMISKRRRCTTLLLSNAGNHLARALSDLDYSRAPP